MVDVIYIGYNDYRVLNNGKRIGGIRKTHLGWRFFPKGERLGGLPFQTKQECEDNLRGIALNRQK